VSKRLGKKVDNYVVVYDDRKSEKEYRKHYYGRRGNLEGRLRLFKRIKEKIEDSLTFGETILSFEYNTYKSIDKFKKPYVYEVVIHTFIDKNIIEGI
jgi:hypothetical protein